MKVECEGCGKDLFGETALEIHTGKVEIGDGWIGFVNDDACIETPGDGFFCSLECIGSWLQKRAANTRK